VIDWETVRALALALPEAEDASGDRPAFRVRGKLFAWKSRPRDGGALAVRVDRDEKQLMIESNPDVYFETPHYHGYPAVLIRLERIDPDELAERIEDAWLIQVPKRLAAQHLGSSRGAHAGSAVKGRVPPAGA
jgi:hypothetical protein